MEYMLLVLAFIFAIINWYAVEKQSQSLEYFSKPGVMVVLIIWVWQNGGLQGWMLWFVLGAIFSLGGDIFLMISRKYFLAGLLSFLLAHIVYFVGFNRSFPPISSLGLGIFLILIIISWQLYIRFAAGLLAQKMERLKIPVLIYVMVITLMTLSAIYTLFREDWHIVAALFVSGGAILFYISDSLNAWYRFISPMSNIRLLSRITYHLGQVGILVGAATHFFL